MIHNSLEDSLKVQKAILEMNSLPKSEWSADTFEAIAWAERYKTDQVTIKGEVKNSGRRSYAEKDPKLVMTVRKLRKQKLTNSEIVEKLYTMGYTTKTGKKFGRGMITRLYQQSNQLVKKTSV
jgi:hypothetical protein